MGPRSEVPKLIVNKGDSPKAKLKIREAERMVDVLREACKEAFEAGREYQRHQAAQNSNPMAAAEWSRPNFEQWWAARSV